MAAPRALVVTGFEPFGSHDDNPSRAVARALDGASVGGVRVRGVVLPVQHTRAAAALAPVIDDPTTRAILELGLAEGRARVALERVAVNVADYRLSDADGALVTGEACVPGAPAEYRTTLPLDRMLAALAAAGVPAYLSDSAGTYLCNRTLYWTLHRLAGRAVPRAGFVHLPRLPGMVARAGVDAPSMSFDLMVDAVLACLGVLVETDA